MPSLDIRTIIFLLFVGNLVSLAALAYYQGVDKSLRAFRFFICGKALQSIAWLLLALRGQIPDLLSAEIGNSLLIAGFALEALTLTLTVSNRPRWNRIYALLAVIGIAAFCFFARTPAQRIVLATLATIALFAPAAAA